MNLAENRAGRTRKTSFTLLFAGVFVALLLLAKYSHENLPDAPYIRPLANAIREEGAEHHRFLPLAPLFDAQLIEDEISWLKGSQMACGAIKQNPSGDRVIPYFANLAARTMTRYEPQWVKDYMNWYLSNLNMPDRWGFEGTIYDYKVDGEDLVPTQDYDSADSYASTFLSLVADYYRNTGDRGFVSENKGRIDLVAGVVLSLQEEDGLVAAKPKFRTKYLMDNCENYRGLLDWAFVLESTGYHDEAGSYKEAAGRIYEGMQGILLDKETGRYAWSLSWLGKRAVRASRWYPDGVSQIMIISCGFLSPESTEAREIWDWFNACYPRWEKGLKRDVFPWSEVAVAAAMMGDFDRVGSYAAWVKEEYMETGRPYPWYILESANLLRALALAQS